MSFGSTGATMPTAIMSSTTVTKMKMNVAWPGPRELLFSTSPLFYRLPLGSMAPVSLKFRQVAAASLRR